MLKNWNMSVNDIDVFVLLPVICSKQNFKDFSINFKNWNFNLTIDQHVSIS